MLYDSLSYYKEYQEIATSYRKEKHKGTVEEFLSKMKKEDRLHPVITLVIYYGEEPWDGPFCLKDMMVEMPQKLREKFSNYQMNLLQVRACVNEKFQNEDVKTVIELSRLFLIGSQKEVAKKKLKKDLLEVIGSIVGWNQISELLEEQEGEEVDMCSMLERIEQEGELRGKIEGMILTLKLLNYKEQDIIAYVVKHFGISEDNAKEHLFH